MWNCLRGHALKRSPGINRKSWVLYHGPGFISSATWPSLPTKHYNGLNQKKKNIIYGKTKVQCTFAYSISEDFFLDRGNDIKKAIPFENTQ